MFTPNHWFVIVSVQMQLTGQSVQVMQHPCRDRHHAQTLLTEIRELAAELEESGLLPGITASGVEVCEHSNEAEIVLPPVGPEGRDAQWWAQAIGLKAF